MSFLLDTNTCIYALNDADGALVKRLRHANAQRVTDFVTPLRELPFDHHIATTYVRMRAAFTARGKESGAIDMLIAATGLAHGLIVVTNDDRAFSRVAGLAPLLAYLHAAAEWRLRAAHGRASVVPRRGSGRLSGLSPPQTLVLRIVPR